MRLRKSPAKKRSGRREESGFASFAPSRAMSGENHARGAATPHIVLDRTVCTGACMMDLQFGLCFQWFHESGLPNFCKKIFVVGKTSRCSFIGCRLAASFSSAGITGAGPGMAGWCRFPKSSVPSAKRRSGTVGRTAGGEQISTPPRRFRSKKPCFLAPEKDWRAKHGILSLGKTHRRVGDGFFGSGKSHGSIGDRVFRSGKCHRRIGDGFSRSPKTRGSIGDDFFRSGKRRRRA